MLLEESEEKLTAQSLKIIEDCRASQGQRANAARVYGQWRETGRQTGPLALGNVLHSHLERTASHLMSPSDLRFEIDFEYRYGDDMLGKAAMAARALSREWERRNIDMDFARGVFEALTYGSCVMKNLSRQHHGEHIVGSRLVLPWQFAVYNEGENSLSDQEACVETVYLTEPEVLRRVMRAVSTPSDARKLLDRIKGASSKETGVRTAMPWPLHQVMSTAVLDVSLQNATMPQPGGIVNLGSDQGYAISGPLVAVDLYPMHELWVRDDERDDDFTTIQIIEPDILVAPRLKRCNLYCEGTLPYGLIQANEVTNYFWGRSEITDLMMLQDWLSVHLEDIKRLVGNQADGEYGFPGHEGLQDEQYARMRRAGFMSSPPGTSIVDLTRQLPPDFLPLIEKILWLMDRVSGFANILSGEGESGVRAAEHAQMLQRNASPHLRDRSLLVERQCAERGDATLAAMEAKDARVFWENEEAGESGEFLLSSLPDDRRVAVDAHSTSPIYHDDQQNLILQGVRAGFITPESAIEQLPYQHKDILLARYRKREKQQQDMLKSLPPEERAKVLERAAGGGRRR
jgi:hypothetical protein